VGLVALAAVVVPLAVGSPGAAPELRALVTRCELETRAASLDVQAQLRSLDPSFELTARELADRAAACAGSIGRMTAAGPAACGRSAAIHGLRSYRLGGEAIAGAGLIRVHRGLNPRVDPPDLLRGEALIWAGAGELRAAVDVLAGRRRCANGIADTRALGADTRRLLPDLARSAVASLLEMQRRVLLEDAIVFGLLLEELDLGAPPPAAAVEAQLAAFAKRNPPLQRWRLLGLRTFWILQASRADWGRGAFTRERFVRAWTDYVTWKTTARGEAINSSLGVIVESDRTWRKALASWQRGERRWYTREQASIAGYDAWGYTATARRALVDAEASLR
jgi:hypothetical protein